MEYGSYGVESGAFLHYVGEKQVRAGSQWANGRHVDVSRVGRVRQGQDSKRQERGSTCQFPKDKSSLVKIRLCVNHIITILVLHRF